jgi:hypothetical protein
MAMNIYNENKVAAENPSSKNKVISVKIQNHASNQANQRKPPKSETKVRRTKQNEQ